MQEVSKGRLLFPAELEVLQEHLHIKVLRQDPVHLNTQLLQHQVGPLLQDQVHLLIPEDSHLRQTTRDHLLMALAQVPLALRQEDRSLLVDLDRPVLPSHLLGEEIRIFLPPGNPSVDLSMECLREVLSALVDIR